MGTLYDRLEPKHIEFIAKQPMFFVATAPKEGRMNLSPKGLDSLRVISPERVQWLNFIGSSNETAAHLLEDHRITLMFCSFGEKPLILRIYGTAKTIHPDDPEWETVAVQFPPSIGARQVVDVNVETVHISCGFGVPVMELIGQRDTLTNWIEKKGEEGLVQYYQDNNCISMDGKPTR